MSMKDHTGISKTVRQIVYDRDAIDGVPCCVICGKPQVEVAHYINRSQGGIGCPENLVCLCPKHHQMFDNGYGVEIKNFLRGYLIGLYPRWSEDSLVYDKWKWRTNANTEKAEPTL